MLCEAGPSGALSRDACRCNGLVDSLAGESYRYRQQNLWTHVNNMGATGLKRDSTCAIRQFLCSAPRAWELAACKTLARTSPG